MKVKFKKLFEAAVKPFYAKSGDAGMDLTCIGGEFGDKIITYDIGLSIEIPEGYVGLIYPRSSIYKTDLVLSNSTGVIDSGYRGEIKVKFRLTKPLADATIYSIGQRVAQLIILPYPSIELHEVSDLTASDRGDTGFGSTN